MSTSIDMDATSTLPYIALQTLAGNDPASLTTLQLWLLPYLPVLTSAWMAIWLTTAAYVLYLLFREGE